MIKDNINNFKRNWFVGDFAPTLYKTDHVEVALQSYSARDSCPEHTHLVACEINVVVKGEVEFVINGVKYYLKKDDILMVHPREMCAFYSITDSTILVVKTASVKDDKYLLINHRD